MHQHRAKTHKTHGWTHCVAKGLCPGRAHGGVTHVDTCSCGCVRETESNGRHRVHGPWLKPSDTAVRSVGGKRRHGGGSKLPSWKKIVVLKDGQPLRHTRRYWQVLNHYLDHGEAPTGYAIVMPGPRVNSLGMAEAVEAKAQRRSRKKVVTPAGEPAQIQKLATEVDSLLK